jgi:hypothetical protein
VDVSDFKPAWSFATEGMKNHGTASTKSDGTPNGNAIYRSDFYDDDMVARIDRVMSLSAIISSPVVAGIFV